MLSLTGLATLSFGGWGWKPRSSIAVVNEYHPASRPRTHAGEQEASDEIPSEAPAPNHGDTGTREAVEQVGAKPSF